MLQHHFTSNEIPLLLPQNPRPKPRELTFSEVNTPAHIAIHVRRITPDICGILDQIAGAVARKTGCSLETAYREAVHQLTDSIAQSINCGAVLFDLNFSDPTPAQTEPTNIIRLVA